MDWFTGVVTYLLIWWLALFAVLPIGTRPVDDPDPDAGGWRGAPAKPLLLQKVIGTTLAAAVLWLGVYALMASGWLSFREGWLAIPGLPDAATRPPAQN
jgi:predicted secreted protein